MKLNSDFLRLVPDGTTHAIVEERQHRGASVFAVIAIIPNGASVPLNGYSSKELAEETCEALNLALSSD